MTYCCRRLEAFEGLRPSIIQRWSLGPWVLVVHNGAPREPRGDALGVHLRYCPWSGDDLPPLPVHPALGPPILHVQRKGPMTDGTGYCCSDMDRYVTSDDLLIRYDPHRGEYGFPMFKPGRRTFVPTGLALRIEHCPWCNKRLPSQAGKGDLASHTDIVRFQSLPVTWPPVAEAPRSRARRQPL